jgi:3'-5' exoribonuclease
MPPFDLRGATLGDRVQHEFLVRERSEKTTRAGLPFVVLTLGNATGSIDTAPIWSEKLEWCSGADRGRVVQVIGDIGSFGDEVSRKRQLQVTAPLRVLPKEQFDPADFLERISVDTERVWEAIDKMRFSIAAPSVRRAVDLFFADDAFRVQFERTPGSVKGHHSQLGGLLLHTWEVASIAKHISRTVRGANCDLAVAGALLHDIGKVESRLGTFGRVAATIVGPRTDRFRLYHAHEMIGAQMLRRAGSSADTIELVEGGGAAASDLRAADDI